MSEERITYDEFMTMFKFAPKMCYTLYDKAEDEIDRLNNIIDELEEYLNQEIIEWQDVNDLWTRAQVQEDRVVLNKLKELKDSD